MNSQASPSKREVIGGPLVVNGKPLPLSKAIKDNGFVFASGQLGLQDGKLVGEDIESQTKKTIENIRDILTAAGTELSRIVSCTVILTDAADFAGFNKVYVQFFPSEPPARTTLIAGLVIPGGKVEITAIAAVGRPSPEHVSFDFEE